jgi:enoyl-CoA hydratase/carnithine racemase
MKYQCINWDLEDNILTLTLNRPEKLNAFNPQMLKELLSALENANHRDEVRVIIITGAGKGFCAGADLSGGQESFKKMGTAENHRDGGGILSLKMYNCQKPLIAAVNGAAVGVGATMLLPMDIRIGSKDSRFGFVFARRGIVPEACSSWFLPRVVGISKALQWCFSGRIIDAQEALQNGLISEVVPKDELLVKAKIIAREIALNTSAVSIALTRQMMWKMLGEKNPMAAHRIDSKSIFALGRSSDAKEGVQSFLEKRKPNFVDKVSADMPKFYPWWDDDSF